MAIIAFFDCRGRYAGSRYRTLDGIIFLVINRGPLARDDNPVAFFEIGDFLRERRQCQSVGPQIGLTIAITDHQRRSEASTNQHIRLRTEGDGERKGPAQEWQYRLHRFLGRLSRLDLFADQMGDNLGIGFAFEFPSAAAQLFAKAFEILDNAIVDEGDVLCGVGMRIVGGRRPMRGPAGMGDTDIAGGIVLAQYRDQIGKLALGPAANQLTVVDRADPGAVIAAIFHPFQPVDQTIRDWLLANYSNNSAHGFRVFRFRVCKGRGFPAYWQGSPEYCE